MRHEHGHTEIRTSRMLVALYLDDLDAYKIVVDELQRCPDCWQAVANWAIGLLAGSRSMAAGGCEAAAGFELGYIDQVLTVTNAPW